MHSKKVDVPTWKAVRVAYGAERLAKHQEEQGERDRTPAPPPETRKSTRKPKKTKK